MSAGNSKIPIAIPIQNNNPISTSVTAAGMAAVQKDVNNVKLGQKKIVELVTGTAACTEAIMKDVKLNSSNNNDLKVAVSELKHDVAEMKNTIKAAQIVKKGEVTPRSFQNPLALCKDLNRLNSPWKAE